MRSVVDRRHADSTGSRCCRPGTYTVTFSLPGFSTVKREGIELTGTFTATIDAELRVGAIEETITVTGETPIVDVQSATRQRVIDRELIDNLPAGRTPFAQIGAHPGRHRAGANRDVGGRDAALRRDRHAASTGAPATSQLLLENGLSTAVLVSPANSQIHVQHGGVRRRSPSTIRARARTTTPRA